MKYKVILTVLFAWIVSGRLSGQNTISLDDVLIQVIDDSFAGESAKTEQQIAEQGFKFYKSQLMPGINFNADIPNYSKTSAPVTQPDGSISFQSIRQANSSIGLSASQVVSATGGTVFATTQINRFDDYSNEFKQYNGIPVRIGIVQPIFGFNPWKYRKKIEPLLLEESKKNYSVQIEEAQTRATILYFDILIADQNLKIARTNEKVNENLLMITEERLTLGKVSKDEKLQLEIELNQAKLSVSQASYQRGSAIAVLFTYIGKSIPRDVVFTVPENKSYEDIDIPSLILAYNSNRPEIIAYQRALAELDSRIAETNALFGPSATVRASFGFARGAENIGDIYSDPFTEQQANLSISLPILDWGKRKSAVSQEKLRRLNIAAGYDQQLLELENSITQRAYALGSLKNEIALLKDIMNKADERATISNERYVLGDIDITNLTLAQREKDQAQRNYINALQSLWVTYYELRGLTGFDVFENTLIRYE